MNKHRCQDILTLTIVIFSFSLHAEHNLKGRGSFCIISPAKKFLAFQEKVLSCCWPWAVLECDKLQGKSEHSYRIQPDGHGLWVLATLDKWRIFFYRHQEGTQGRRGHSHSLTRTRTGINGSQMFWLSMAGFT